MADPLDYVDKFTRDTENTRKALEKFRADSGGHFGADDGGYVSAMYQLLPLLETQAQVNSMLLSALEDNDGSAERE